MKQHPRGPSKYSFDAQALTSLTPICLCGFEPRVQGCSQTTAADVTQQPAMFFGFNQARHCESDSHLSLSAICLQDSAPSLLHTLPPVGGIVQCNVTLYHASRTPPR